VIVQNNEVKKDQSNDPDWHLAKLRQRIGAGFHVLYSDGSLKGLAVCMVSAEMLNCKLLSTQVLA
jgi:hypothetical protein